MYVKYQVVHTINHRANNEERPIHTFNNPLIVVLFCLDTDFHLQLCERMLQKATISLNILQQSRLHPHLSAYIHLYVGFDYNCTYISQPGKIVVNCDRPKDRASWPSHGEPDWYIRPAMEHYRCHKAYIPKTTVEQISDTVEFFPRKLVCRIFHIQLMTFIPNSM